MLILAIRTLILYLLVVIIMRIMNKPQIGELQPFELVVAIILSELAAVAMSDTEVPLLNSIIPILTLLLAQVTLAYLTLKSGRARAIICGTPSLLIEKGRINEEELRHLRMNINDLLEQLRVKNFPNIADVDYAIMETNGELSVIPKGTCRPVITKDLGIKAENPGLPITLIVDGVIQKKNIAKAQISEKELKKALEDKGVNDISEIFLASIDSKKTLTWQRKEVNKKDA